MSFVKLADYQDKERWDDFVLSHEGAGPYHLFAWKEAVEDAYRHKAFYLIHENDDKTIQGVLPLFHVKLPLLKGMLVSQPFCDYGGILARDRDSIETLAQYAYDLSRGLRAKLEIRLKGREPIFESSMGYSPMSKKSRMLLELPGSSEALWNGFKSKLRSQIRKPRKDGLTFTMGSQDKIDDFYSIFCSNMRHLGSPVHSRKWINSVIDSFGENARIGVVYLGDHPVGAGIILCFRETVSIPWASTLHEYNSLSPNMLLYWGFLEYASDNGFRYFDFGRSTPGEGTYRFKEQWGALPDPLFWYGEGFSNPSGHDVAGKIRPMIEKTWARIPQKVTDTLGPMVRRFITL